jgi:hypothetical protein
MEAAAAGRLSLHCTKLTVTHPTTGLPLTLNAPVPLELAYPSSTRKTKTRTADKDEN